MVLMMMIMMMTMMTMTTTMRTTMMMMTKKIVTSTNIITMATWLIMSNIAINFIIPVYRNARPEHHHQFNYVDKFSPPTNICFYSAAA